MGRDLPDHSPETCALVRSHTHTHTATERSSNRPSLTRSSLSTDKLHFCLEWQQDLASGARSPLCIPARGKDARMGERVSLRLLLQRVRGDTGSATLMRVLLLSFWLTSGLFMMFLALLAYSNVLRVSCTAQHQRSSVRHKPLETSRTSLKISGFHLTGTTRQTSRLEEDGDTVAMIDVFVRPPSESCRILVSLDSLEDKMTFVHFKKARVSTS